MNHEEFFNYVKSSVSKFLGEGYSVSLNKVFKNNGLELTGIVITEEGITAAPTIYLNDFYKEYRAGKAPGQIINEVVSIYEESRCRLEMDFSFFADYDKIKNHILYKVLNWKANKRILEDVPHKTYMDLAIVFYVLIDNDIIGNGSILIHNNHMQLWHVDTDEIYEMAVKNTPRLMPYRFSSMENVVEEIFGTQKAVDSLESDEKSNYDMYILTNTHKFFGASCMLYDNLLKRISEKLRSSLYIIPSSVHELIIIPKTVFSHEKKELIEIVRSMNTNEIDPQDMLSDTVYEYDREQGGIRM